MNAEGTLHHIFPSLGTLPYEKCFVSAQLSQAVVENMHEAVLRVNVGGKQWIKLCEVVQDLLELFFCGTSLLEPVEILTVVPCLLQRRPSRRLLMPDTYCKSPASQLASSRAWAMLPVSDGGVIIP